MPPVPASMQPDPLIVDGMTEPQWSAQFTDELDQDLARRQWRIIVGELRQSDKLANANERQVKRLVDAYVLYEIAMRHVADEGAVFPRKGKKQPAYNPWFTIMKDANAMASAAEAELTITPRRRNNGGKVQKQKQPSFGGGFLKAVPK
ncbi:P27 family phage terminase small subunit [Tardiphaga sp. OK246]|uniref:P27 family phage terminase small subunit n=1 Tax=Tardiphaga sp. OK246 TaxID=1855307 RepID=UPI001FCD6787|nr:P27 family phage terminase small subunit [Tardiphaga sp. OK246]